MALNLKDVPIWAWILLAVLALVAVPIKLRIWKSILNSRHKSGNAEEDEEA